LRKGNNVLAVKATKKGREASVDAGIMGIGK